MALLIILLFLPLASASYRLIPFNISCANAADNNLTTACYSGDPENWVYVDFNVSSSLLASVSVNISTLTTGVFQTEQAFNYSSGNYETIKTSNSGEPHWDNTTLGSQYISGSILKIRLYQGTPCCIGNAYYIFEVWAYGIYVPTLYTPTNLSTQSTTYPPLNTNINFTWSYYNSNLLIAKDSNFNLIAVNTVTTNNYSVQSLEDGNYWWKVRYYNSTSGTYGNYSDTFNFTLSNQQTITGTGIQGIIYELVNGVQIPISGATVTIVNNTATWTNTQIVGNNGYYLFTGLSNSTTYQIKASRQDIYTDSIIYYVTTGLGTVTTQNILLQRCVSGFNCFYNQQYVQYTVQNLLFTKYAGVTATVYKGTDIVPQTLPCNPNSCNTGTDGIINILLIKDQEYTITFINSLQGISMTWKGYPSKTDYMIIVPTTLTGTFTGGIDSLATVHTNISMSIINTTAAIIYANYSDTSDQTSGLTFYLNQSITGDPYNQTNLQIISGGSSGTFNASFTVSPYSGNGYIINVYANHVTLGSLSSSYAVQFPISSPFSYFNPLSVLMLGIGLIIFFAGFFGQTSTEQGAAVIVGLVWLLDGIAVWSGLNVITFHLGLTLATVIVILMNSNARGRKEGMS